MNALEGGVFDCSANTSAEVNCVSYLAVARRCAKYWETSVRLSSQCFTHESFIDLGASTGQLIFCDLCLADQWLQTALGQHKFLPTCRTTDYPKKLQ